MKSFLKFAVSFFVLCLVIFAFGYFFGPASFRDSLRDPNSPVGQLDVNDSLQSPGEQVVSPTAPAPGTASGTTQPAADEQK